MRGSTEALTLIAARLRFLWLGLMLFQLSLLLHLVAYLMTPGKGESAAFLGIAGLTVVFAFIVIGLGITLWRWPEWWTYLRLRVDARLFLGLSLTILALFGLQMRAEWFYAHLSLALSASFALLYATLYGISSPVQIPRSIWVFGVLLLIAITFIRAYGLSAYPEMEIIDEPWDFGFAVSHVHTGQISDSIMMGLNGSPRYDVPRFYLIMAAWFRLVGVGFWQARFLTFLLTIPVMIFTALAARNLYGERAGWFTGAAMFASALLMFGARIRHDIGLALLIAASLWVYSEAAKRERQWLYFVAGLLLGWGMFAHYNASLFGMAVALGLFVPRYLIRIRRGNFWPESGFILFILGGAISGIIVIAIQVLPNLEGFLSGNQRQEARTALQILRATGEYIWRLTEISRLEFILILLGLAAMLWRRRLHDWSFPIIFGLTHIALAVMSVGWFKQYLVQLAPVYGIIVGTLFSEGFQVGLSERKGINRGAAVALAMFLLPALGFTIRAPLTHVLQGKPVQLPPPQEVTWVLENIPPDATIAAANYYYLWLTDYQFASPLIPRFMLPSERAKYDSVEAVWDMVSPDVWIFNSRLDPHQAQLSENYLESRGYGVAAQLTGDNETITIYRREQDIQMATIP